MAISSRLKEFLDQEDVHYDVLHHTAAFTASEIAGAQHVPGKNVLKSVIVKAGDQYLMVVLSATHMIDFDKLSSVSGMKNLELASEDEISKLFPDYDIGAEPPFGHLYGLKVFIDKKVQEDRDIVFNAGTHTDMIKMKKDDFIRLAEGKIADIGRHI